MIIMPKEELLKVTIVTVIMMTSRWNSMEKEKNLI